MLDLFTVGSTFTRPACRALAAAINQYLLLAPDLSDKPNPPAAVAAVDRRDRQTDTQPCYDGDRVLCGPRNT